MTQTVPDISPLMPMHQDPLLVIILVFTSHRPLPCINKCKQYWITNTKQACILLLPSGFDLITEPEVLIGVWSRAHPVCDRAALSVDREITLTQPPLRAPKPGITSQPQPASQLNIGTQLTSREQTWHQSHAVAWFLNFTSYNLKCTEKHG